jgi:choline transport protein
MRLPIASQGQYHWISEFAPRYQKPLSYVAGWWSTIAWQSTAAGATFLAGSFIPSLAALFHPDYVPTPWQNNLCVFALVGLILLINATSTKPLVHIQMIAMVVLFIGWMPVAGCLGGLAPHPRSFHDVVTTFTSDGWDNMGIAVLVGQISNVYALTCEWYHLDTIKGGLTDIAQPSTLPHTWLRKCPMQDEPSH